MFFGTCNHHVIHVTQKDRIIWSLCTFLRIRRRIGYQLAVVHVVDFLCAVNTPGLRRDLKSLKSILAKAYLGRVQLCFRCSFHVHQLAPHALVLIHLASVIDEMHCDNLRNQRDFRELQLSWEVRAKSWALAFLPRSLHLNWPFAQILVPQVILCMIRPISVVIPSVVRALIAIRRILQVVGVTQFWTELFLALTPSSWVSPWPWLNSQAPSWPLFDTVFRFLCGSQRKWLKWLQQNVEKFMIFNKRSKWFHSSLVNLPLVSMSASWFLVSTHLICILESKLILSNNKSNAALWVPVRCLIVRLLSLIIIFITTSSSWKMYSWDSPWEGCVFLGTWSTSDNCSTLRIHCRFFSSRVGWLILLLFKWKSVRSQFSDTNLVGFLVLFVESNTSITTTQRSRAKSPSILDPASNKIISESVEQWDTDVCFWHIQLTKTNVRLPKIHNNPPEDDSESSESPAKSTMLSRVSHMTILSEVTCVMNIWNQSFQTSVASLSPFCDCTSKIVDRPQNVWSSDSCQVLACQCSLWANLW